MNYEHFAFRSRHHFSTFCFALFLLSLRCRGVTNGSNFWYRQMTVWHFPNEEQWRLAWEAAHAVYASEIDPSEELLCQALLWQARAICIKDNDQN